jgi:mRNA-degrading endonuclease HigB of HigAB toxin-antitoxin module
MKGFGLNGTNTVLREFSFKESVRIHDTEEFTNKRSLANVRGGEYEISSGIHYSSYRIYMAHNLKYDHWIAFSN